MGGSSIRHHTEKAHPWLDLGLVHWPRMGQRGSYSGFQQAQLPGQRLSGPDTAILILELR
jgi:hypothetical protein